MRRFLIGSGAGLSVLLASAAIDHSRVAPSSALRSASADTRTVLTGEPLRAAMLLQRSDCSGNLRMFDLLHRRGVGERVRLGVIWYVGDPRDSTIIRRLLPAWTRHADLKPAPRAVIRELATLGHRSTPVVIMYDQEGRVRLTSQSPRSPREFAGLRRAIEGLTWIEQIE
ncbi:MAG: hypothetical protein K2R93_13465 [Gemmatimonadaceae bacterium]|nr:hypothetical protein [Gemmatimonadaceae bacterium]